MKTRLLFNIAIVFTILSICTNVYASEITGDLTTGLGNAVEGVVIFSPSASPTAGSYGSTQNVVLSASGSSSIRYTLDETNPTCSIGSTYSSAIAITSTKTLKAISCYSGGGQSSVVSFTYTLSSIETKTSVALTSTGSGESASMPVGITSLKLSNDTFMDVSASVSNVVAGSITVGGVVKTMESFSSGNLSSVNLSTPVTIGDQVMTVGRAVKIESGVDNQPTVLTNNDLTTASVSIPDSTTILAPTGWDGEIKPPKAGNSSGSTPSGFSVGSVVVEVGSTAGVLLFDKPVSIVLSGVTGTVAYKASGSSTWTRINSGCGGTYDSPSAPTFPGECFISNGTDTKIFTYHFTTFASLTTSDSGGSGGSSGSGGGGGGGGSYLASSVVTASKTLSAEAQKVDANNDSKIDVLDFVSLMANWGKTGSSVVADFNKDTKVDVLDFVMLMVNWTK